MLRSVTFLKEIFKNKAELQDVDVPTSSLPLSRRREPCVFNFLPAKACCRTRMQSKGLDPPHANPCETTSRLRCCQNACELFQEGKPAICGGCLKFHAHGKGVETTGSRVFLKHLLKKSEIWRGWVSFGAGIFPCWVSWLFPCPGLSWRRIRCHATSSLNWGYWSSFSFLTWHCTKP